MMKAKGSLMMSLFILPKLLFFSFIKTKPKIHSQVYFFKALGYYLEPHKGLF